MMLILLFKICKYLFFGMIIVFPLIFGFFTGMEWQKEKKKQNGFKIGYTNRGFAYCEFKDDNGVTCSIQNSSSAEKPKIWLGAEAVIKEFYPMPRDTDESWFTIEDLSPLKHRPQNSIHVFSRMHLTQEHVKQLLPHLEKFIETGEI